MYLQQVFKTEKTRNGIEVQLFLRCQNKQKMSYWFSLHSDICLLTAYQNKHLLTGAKWSKNMQTNDLRTLRTDFLAWLWFVVLTFRAVCNAGQVQTIHILHTTLYAKCVLVIHVQNNKHTIKDQWFEHSIVPAEWTDLGNGMARLFDSFVPRWSVVKAQPLLCIAI